MIIHRHFFAIFLLLIGATIYIIFREPVLFTQPLLDTFGKTPFVKLDSSVLNNIIRFHLPDALWCTALLLYVPTFGNKFFKIIAVLMSPIMELGQLIGFIPGTFDIFDLITYTTITIIFLIVWKKRNQESQYLAIA